MSNSKDLNDQRIRRYPKPDKTKVITDHGKSSVSGMVVRMYPSGNKVFYLRYRWNDSVLDYKIGDYPDIGLSDARDRARELKQRVSDGIDPAAEKRLRKNAPDKKTIRDLAEDYKADYLPKKKPSTQTTYTSRINKIVKTFGMVPIDDLTGRDIKVWLKKVAKKHPTSANRLQAILSSMYSYANEPDQNYTTNHPLKGMKKISKEKQREPEYNNDDIRTLWEAFSQQDEPLQTLLKMLMLTGQRLGETRRMKWADIDRDQALWVIPKTETKGKRTHVVPLCGMVINILENVHQLTGTSDYVFASHMKANQPLAHFNGATMRIRKFDGLNNFRIHDLRHIAITGMIEIGIDMVHVGKAVAHKGLGKEYTITSRYAHYEYLDEKRKALLRWSDHLQRILNRETDTKIFKIGR